MTDQQPSNVKNLDRYGSAPLEWSRVHDVLENTPVHPDIAYFLTTVRADGRPHTVGIGALWLDGNFYFTSAHGTLKSRNLAVQPVCTIAVRLPGIDLVFEGKAALLTEQAMLEEVARRYREGGWPCEVAGDALTAPFSAPSAGPPPWYVYRFTFDTVSGVATKEPNGATLWEFEH